MNSIISAKKEVAKDTLEVTFSLHQEATFQPGQFIFVTLPELKFPDSRGPKRHFSIVNSPNDNSRIIITTRIREESGFKKTLAGLPIGTEIELSEPKGKFILPENMDADYVFIAGGIGITPYMSILTYIQQEQLPYNITLLYANKDRHSTAYFQEISQMDQDISGLTVHFIMSRDESWDGDRGRIDEEYFRKNISDFINKQYMVVGPPAMANGITEILTAMAVPKENIQQENFSGY